MKRYLYALIPLILCILALSFRSNNNPVTGAEQPEKYTGMLRGKSVAVLANQTSVAGKDHLVDILIRAGINVKVIFAPEHGFREMADAGETINDGKDAVTGVSVISLYGKHNKPTKDDLNGVDVVVFDIQDVGTRFYTYISTLHYLLESCAENGVSCIVLDRPNPNGIYVDGNILDTAYRSFVGLDPVPIVHGMTVGEYALMLNGEGWFGKNLKCDLQVITCKNYTHDTKYELPIKPSPNLPNLNSVYLYPSLCFFEGTNISVGRGTDFPFQVYGAPELPDRGFSFIPESVPGAKNPPFLGKKCFGKDLRNAIKDRIVPSSQLNLGWVIEAYNNYPDKDKFFTSYFDVLAGGPSLRQQIISGKSAEEIRASWSVGLEKFKKIRSKYLLYE
jgi:uncharacterized protein YbbC (DUF1343 family)